MRSAIDKDSPVWAQISRWAQYELSNAQTLLAGQGISERDSDVIRGRIAQLRSLLALAVPEPDISPTMNA